MQSNKEILPKKVMTAIISFQKKYLLSGLEKDLKPMSCRYCASHTWIFLLYRVSNSKYVETNFGTFKVKEFSTRCL